MCSYLLFLVQTEKYEKAMNKNVITKLSRLSYMWRLLIIAPQFTGVFLVHQEFTRFSNGGEVLSQSNIGHDFTDTIHLGI